MKENVYKNVVNMILVIDVVHKEYTLNHFIYYIIIENYIFKKPCPKDDGSECHVFRSSDWAILYCNSV